MLDVYQASDTNGANIQVYFDNGTDNQKWRIIQNANGTYRIMPAISSTRCADVYGGGTNSGADIKLWTYSGNTNQQWKMESATILGVPQLGQEMSNWCWAASARMVACQVALTPPSQSSIVASVKNSVINDGGDVSETLAAVKFASINNMIPYYWTNVLSLQDLISKISEGKPVIIFRDWMAPDGSSTGRGHVTVIYGLHYATTGTRFLIRDPEPENVGRTYVRTYAEIVDGRSTGVDTGVWAFSITR